MRALAALGIFSIGAGLAAAITYLIDGLGWSWSLNGSVPLWILPVQAFYSVALGIVFGNVAMGYLLRTPGGSAAAEV
jgi:hypothetical protein